MLPTMEKLPILPFPEFLSPAIRQYIDEISAQSGRIIVFGDHQWLQAQEGIFLSIAASFTPAPWPGAVIYVNAQQMKCSSYRADRDDPVIAHEVTHVALLAEGWHHILPNGNQPDDIREKIKTVENWLTDAVVNERLPERGFGLKVTIDELLKGYFEELNMKSVSNRFMRSAPGYITSRNVQTGLQETQTFIEIINLERTYQIRRYVSLMLEPDIVPDERKRLQTTFQDAFPEFFDSAQKFLEIIGSSGLGVSHYVQTARLCLQEWGVGEQQYRFEPHQPFDKGSQQDWLTIVTRVEGNWNNS